MQRLKTLLLGTMLAAALAGLGRAAAQAKPTAEADVAQGRQLFLNYCAGCHGQRGDGKTATGLAMRPPAFDLTNFELADSLLWRVLQNGVLGTGMPGWSHALVGNQMASVVAYTARLGRNDQLSAQQRVAPESALLEAGRRVYLAHCTRCHGEQGQGDGPEAARYRPPPPNFAEMRPSYAAAARVIGGGVPGTAMPAWPRLTPEEVQAVTFYIRSLYRGPERSSMPPSNMRRHSRMAQR
ncbi:MAG: c-type cytochrome [Chlamydiota bacterium]